MTPLAADRAEVAGFVEPLFRHADEGTFVSLRSFPHRRGEKPARIEAVKLNGHGFGALVTAAERHATWAANHRVPLVFAPPVATFTNPNHATEADLAQGLAISFEIDEGPKEALQTLMTTLGIPTVIMESGGTWTDPNTGEAQKKLHIHFRLREPTRDPVAHTKLKQARRLGVRLVGADATTITMVHPLRWAGSLHLKDPDNPKLARVVGGDPDADIDLDEALRLLTEACALAGINPDPATTGEGRQEHRETAELIQRITTGTEYLAPLVALSARYAGAGMSKRQIIETLRGFLEAVPAAVRDMKDGKPVKGRWQDRWNGVERMAGTAVRNFGPQGKGTVEHGAEVAREIIASAAAKASGEQQDPKQQNGAWANEWPEPELLNDADEPEPFPLDALPPIAGDAVVEYQRYGQQPIEMVGNSALAAMSAAAQGLVDVRRDRYLVGPVSINTVTIADSGERKTACDNAFQAAGSRWEKSEQERLAPKRRSAIQDRDTHASVKKGLLNRAAEIGKQQPSPQRAKELDSVTRELRVHEVNLPPMPPQPVAKVENGTSEGIANVLRFGWPSLAWASNEGATVTAGHGFSDTALARTMAFINQRWDGAPMDRARSGEDFSKVHGRRMSVSLMLQPHAFRQMVKAGEGAARGLGLLARNLTAWPTSTMGTRLRPENDEDPELPALERFLERAGELYRLPLPMAYDLEKMKAETDRDGNPVEDVLELRPKELPLSHEAHRAWTRFHNEIETELAPDGEFADVRDVAAKAAENACRLAAIFHVWRNGPRGAIDVEDMERGARLTRWYVHEARRVLGAGDESGNAEDALLLARWAESRPAPLLLADVAQLGPYRLRKKKPRDAALALLVAKKWARLIRHEGKAALMLSPNLRWED